MRRPLIAGNWKMHKTIGEATAFVRELFALAPSLTDVDAVIFPPFTALAAMRDALGASVIGLGGQTMWYTDSGAVTGEIAPPMLIDCGARWVLLGHSERRACAGETDAAINRKVRAALDHGLTPLVAVGESAEEHAAGHTHERVVAQTRAAFAGLDEGDVARCALAYEPIWAIGSGISDTPDGANAVMGEIRDALPGLHDARILYGGSVKPGNVGAFLAQPNIDGGLVGGASLDPVSFCELIANAATVTVR
jgi:triosephosphate isomerase